MYIDFKQAYDSVDRGKLFQAMIELGIPKKFVKLTKMRFKNTQITVKIKGAFPDQFRIETRLRQSDVLSVTLFNIFLE